MKTAALFAFRRTLFLFRFTFWCVVMFYGGIAAWKTVQAAVYPFGGFARWYSVTVPDHCYEQDPEVLVARTFLRPFVATWHVQVESATDANMPPICLHSETTLYSPRPTVTTTTPLSAYLGTRCVIPPGRWKMLTWRELADPWRWPEPSGVLESNAFTVKPREECAQSEQE